MNKITGTTFEIGPLFYLLSEHNLFARLMLSAKDFQ